MHDSTKQDIERILASRPHALGIQGDKDSGKRYLSEYIAGKVLGIDDVSTYPYFLELDCRQKIGIEEVRGAIKFLALKIPGDNKYKRCIIFLSFDNLGHEAQNALLKSIEEPPEDTLIVITTASKYSLLPTTASRLSWVNVRPVSIEDAKKFFSLKYNENDIKKAHMLSDGSPGLMTKLLKDYDNHPLVRSVSFAKEVLGKDRLARLSIIEKTSKDKEFDLEAFLNSLVKIYEVAYRNDLKKSGRPDKKLLSDLKKIINAQNTLLYNANQKLVLTNLLYNL